MEIDNENNLNSVSVSPASASAQKKLKQTRLPFAILSPVSTTTTTSVEKKKRKLSGEDSEVALPATKVSKVQATKKENTVVVSEVVDLVDSEEDGAPETDEKDKIRIKLPISGKKNHNKKLKLDESVEENKHHSKTKKHKSHTKKEVKHKSVPVEATEVVCLEDDDDDDDPKPLETSVVEETSVEIESKEVPVTSEGLPKPDFTEKDAKSHENSPSKVTEQDETSSTSTEKSSEEIKTDVISNDDLNESLPGPKPSTPGSGIKRSSHKKLSEEEKLKRQQEREEARRLERESKEALKRQEREAKEQQRLREKQEREAKLQKEREEKEAQKRAEKEEREKKKQAELEQKAEEKRQKELKKEEERLKKEEEKLKKEQEKQQREEEERRKKEEAGQKWKKSAQLMEKLFVQKKNDTKQPEEESSNDSEKLQPTCQNFMPFHVKENMRLAPVTRASLDNNRRQILENTLLNTESVATLTYLRELKGDSGYNAGKCCSISWQKDDDSQDIILIDNHGEEHQIEQNKKPKQKYKAKFLHFEENRRPAYYGTWRKKSTKVTGRRPFAVDTKIFDYEVDSDEEWEEEEPGESLHGSDDEKDKDNVDDDYEVDNEFFVPHGHLSDEELEPDGEVIPEDNSPEAMKALLQIRQREFAEEQKKKTEKIKPRIIGCIWVRTTHGGQDQCSPIVWEMLSARAMIFSEPITTILDDPEDEKVEASSGTVTTKKIKITEDGIKELIRLVHGNPNSKKFLSDEFAAYRKQKYGENEGYQEFMLITTKIKEIAEYKQCIEEGPMFKINAWFVKPEILEKYQLADLPIMNTWEYVLTPKNVVTENSNKKSLTSTPTSVKKVPVTEEAMPDLIRLVHGNMRNRQFLIKEFRAFRKATYGHLSDFQEFYHIGSTIQRIAEYKKCEEEGPMKGKTAYFVHNDILKQYGMENTPLPNNWQYHAVEKKKETQENTTTTTTTTSTPQPGAGPLTKFAVKITEEERQKSLNKPAPQKKRVQLISFPRETAPETKKTTLISQFLQKGKNDSQKENSITTTKKQEDDDDVMIID